MKKACIFDLDGTLADTVESMAYCANKVLKELDLAPLASQRFRYFAGDGVVCLAERCLKEAGDNKAEKLEVFLNRYQYYFKKDCMYQVRVYPGIRELLEELKKRKLKVSVFSNKPHEQAVKVVDSLFGRDYFDMVLGQTAEIKRKPAPDGALKITDHFNMKPEEFCT